MKRILFLLLLLLPCLARALNLPHISTENLPRIEAGAKMARENGWPVRIQIGMPDATKGSALDFYAIDRAAELLKGLPVVLVDYTQPSNSKYVRALFAVPNSQADVDLWRNWKNPDCKKEIPESEWPVYQQISDALYNRFLTIHAGTVIRQLENEPGNVVDASLDPALPYGYVRPEVRRFLEYRISNSSGVLCAPAWETQSMEGLLEQIDAENRRVYSKCAYQSINWYLTKWLPGDTPTKWAKRCIAEIKAFKEGVWWPGRPVIVSELGAIGCPKERRVECYKAFLRYAPSWMKYTCWYTYKDPQWGLAN